MDVNTIHERKVMKITDEKLMFKAEVKKQLALHKWSYADLAKHTGYTKHTITQMMYDDSRLSPRAMGRIAEALGIEIE